MTSPAFLIPLGVLFGFFCGYLRYHKPWMEDQLARYESHIEWQRLAIKAWTQHSQEWQRLYQDCLRALSERAPEDVADWWKDS